MAGDHVIVVYGGLTDLECVISAKTSQSQLSFGDRSSSDRRGNSHQHGAEPQVLPDALHEFARDVIVLTPDQGGQAGADALVWDLTNTHGSRSFA